MNPELVPQLEAAGLRFVGKDDTATRMEIVELAGHPFFVAAQFHPEFKSRPFKPSPLFLGLILAASGGCTVCAPCWCCAASMPAGSWEAQGRQPTLFQAVTWLLTCLPPRPLPAPTAGKLDHYLSGRATPLASPAKSGLRPVENVNAVSLAAAKLQL